jgi:hypothetical protein
MTIADNISLLRRKRVQQIDKLTTLSKQLDQYDQSGQHKELILLIYEEIILTERSTQVRLQASKTQIKIEFQRKGAPDKPVLLPPSSIA